MGTVGELQATATCYRAESRNPDDRLVSAC